jgi:hypothetical protein
VLDSTDTGDNGEAEGSLQILSNWNVFHLQTYFANSFFFGVTWFGSLGGGDAGDFSGLLTIGVTSFFSVGGGVLTGFFGANCTGEIGLETAGFAIWEAAVFCYQK